MNIKFETKSARVKATCFHPIRPWLLSSLHSGVIQIWDYRLGILINQFQCNGPVRAVNFHPTQQLLCSGGDDYLVRVFDYKQELFTLSGHLDYVRSVQFNNELPWIVSASDDQTIRIWNWQSRQCIAIVTGHNHYVMCAQFHSKEDILVSCALDQTIRVWDWSGLRKKGRNEVFGNEVNVKFICEGHYRGVNWVNFHPTMNLIASGSDDRTVKLWRYNEVRCWEVDNFRGHFNNVSCVAWHGDMIVSVSEDKTLRVWDTKDRTCVYNFKREVDRFWFVTTKENLFCAAHDSGIVLFKLNRERPPFALVNDTLFYVSNDRVYNTTDNSLISLNLKRARTLSVNPVEKTFLVSNDKDYELVADGKNIYGSGKNAVFINRNRFAVLVDERSIVVKDLKDTIVKTIELEFAVTKIQSAGSNHLLLITATECILYDVNRKEAVNKVKAAGVKYCVWSKDYSFLVLMSKHTLTFVDSSLKQMSKISEHVKIKSCIVYNPNIVIYTTLSHLKFSLLNGDNGVIKSLENDSLYLTHSDSAETVYAMNKQAKFISFEIETCEFKFKQALLDKNYELMFHLIKEGNLVGQSIIYHLEKKGYPEIALNFVQDPDYKFRLAIECGNIGVALEIANQLGTISSFTQLSEMAMKLGNVQVSEMCLQKIRGLERLSFLYLLTGNRKNLNRMIDVADSQKNYEMKYQNSLYAQNAEKIVETLLDGELYALAYSSARLNGLNELAKEIKEKYNVDESEIVLPEGCAPLKKNHAVRDCSGMNWPTREVKSLQFDNDDNPKSKEGVVQRNNELKGIFEEEERSGGNEVKSLLPVDIKLEDAEAGWGLDEQVQEIQQQLQDKVVISDGNVLTPGTSLMQSWSLNNPSVFAHAASGSFETATQWGIVNVAPLKDHFMKAYAASRALVSPFPLLPSQTIGASDPSNPKQPTPIWTVSQLQLDLHEALRLTTTGKFSDALSLFTAIIQTLPFTSLSPSDPLGKQLITTCREYIRGLSFEKQRRETSDTALALSFSTLFTQCSLQPLHHQLALRSAMTFHFKHQNYKSAARFARELLEVEGVAEAAVGQARQILAVEGQGDAVLVIEVEEGNEECGYCGAKGKGKCGICGIGWCGKGRKGVKVKR